MATDPTGARMRTINAFFDSPRFPIKELPPLKGERDDHDHDHDHHDDREYEHSGKHG